MDPPTDSAPTDSTPMRHFIHLSDPSMTEKGKPSTFTPLPFERNLRSLDKCHLPLTYSNEVISERVVLWKSKPIVIYMKTDSSPCGLLVQQPVTYVTRTEPSFGESSGREDVDSKWCNVRRRDVYLPLSFWSKKDESK